MATPARPGSFTGATDNAASGGLFTDTLIDGIPDIIGVDVARAETAATSAEASASTATTQAASATTSATTATTKATAASTDAASASASKTSATASQTAATASQTAAAASETAAGTSATNAAASQSAAASSATSAGSSNTTAAQSANSALSSASAASTSASAASTSKTAAAASEAAALVSKNAAATSATNAATSETNASTSETNSAASETAAAGSATTSSQQATISTTKAGESATSSTNAATSETNSASSATSASSSQSAASTSATSAASSLTTFQGLFISSASAPSSPDVGDLWYDTTNSELKVYVSGSGWQIAGAYLQGLIANHTFTCTANQTAFTTDDASGTMSIVTAVNVFAYLNGIKLIGGGTDYSISGNTITLVSGAIVSDVLYVDILTKISTTQETALDALVTQATAAKTAAELAETNAETAETNAETAETNAAASAATASTKATATTADAVSTAADKVATNADVVLTAADVVSAEADRVSCASDRAAITTIYDTFDDRYLGTKTSDPTVDNNGNALIIGAMYFNSTVDNTRFYNGSSWEDPEATATSGAATATTKASEASTSATSAASSATTATAQAGIATTQAGNSATSATSSAGSLTSFNGIYRGESGSAPSSPATGQLWYDSTNAAMKVYSGSAWVAAYVSGSGFLATSGGSLTGAVTTNSTFDGRDVATDGTKLDGIEASADVTDAANVTAAGALMDSEVTNLAQVKAFASSDYATAAQGTLATNALPKAGGAMTGTTTHGDNVKSTWGTAPDLEIYHNGSHSRIADVGAGKIQIGSATQVEILNGTFSEPIAQFNPDGAVTLYYDNAAKIATSATGISVTGDVTATGTVEPAGDTAAGDNAAIGYTAAEGLILTGQGSTSDITLKNDADAVVFTVPTGTDDILFPDNARTIWGAGSDFSIFHDGSNTYLTETGGGTGNVFLRANDLHLLNNSNEEYITCASDGAVTLYHNDVAKLATTSTGIDVTGTATASSATLNVKSGTTADSTGQPSGNFASTIYHAINSSTANGLLVKNNWAASASTVFEVGLDISGGAYRQYYKVDGAGQSFWSPGGAERMRVTSTGIDVTGAIVASGNITAYSDLRIKDNLEVIPDALSKVKQLSGYTYTRTDLEDKEAKYTGVIAQEVLKVLPEAVSLGKTPEDTMSVAYGNIVGLLIEAIKEQQVQIDELKATVESKGVIS